MDSQIQEAEREAQAGLMRAGDYLRVRTRRLGDHLILVVSGEADHYTADTLHDELRRSLTPATRSVAVEVSQMSFCDLAGLRALHGFCSEATSRHVPVAIHGMSPMLTMLSTMFAPLPEPTNGARARP